MTPPAHSSSGSTAPRAPGARCPSSDGGPPGASASAWSCLERPGVGDSTDYTYPQLRDISHDVAIAADRLGHDRFMVVGLSGGGPYALACAHDLPSRVVAVAVMGSVVPTVDDEELAEGLVALTRQWNQTLRLVRWPVGLGLTGLVRVATPVARFALEAFARILPPGDQRVLGDPDIQSMIIDDLVHGTRRHCQAVVNDLILFGRPWGFRLADVRVPVYWWHGDVDPFVPIDQAYRAASLLPDVEFVVRPGESHLGEFAAADQVLSTLAGVWSRESGGAGTIVALPGLHDLNDQHVHDADAADADADAAADDDDDAAADADDDQAESGPATIS